jgi:hypothetical protein
MNARHLMLNEYLKEFIDPVMKPSRSTRPSSNTVYQGSVILYAKGISEKFTHIGNCFNLRTIFRTRHTQRGTLMKTGQVRDVASAKQADL